MLTLGPNVHLGYYVCSGYIMYTQVTTNFHDGLYTSWYIVHCGLLVIYASQAMCCRLNVITNNFSLYQGFTKYACLHNIDV